LELFLTNIERNDYDVRAYFYPRWMLTISVSRRLRPDGHRVFARFVFGPGALHPAKRGYTNNGMVSKRSRSLLGSIVFLMAIGMPVALAFLAANILGAWIFMGGERGIVASCSTTAGGR
jgi:hypothetical protein